MLELNLNHFQNKQNTVGLLYHIHIWHVCPRLAVAPVKYERDFTLYNIQVIPNAEFSEPSFSSPQQRSGVKWDVQYNKMHMFNASIHNHTLIHSLLLHDNFGK